MAEQKEDSSAQNEANPGGSGLVRGSQTLFQAVWEESCEALRLTDGDGRITAVNPAFCSLMEMEARELVGQLLNVTCADEKKRDEVLLHYRKQFGRDCAGCRFELRLKLRSGREVTLEETFSLVKGHGSQPLCLAMVRDTTGTSEKHQKLQRSEAFFRSIWENSTDGMRLTNAEGKILAVNDAFCRLVKLPRERLVGFPFPAAYATEYSDSSMLEGYRQRCLAGAFGTRHQARITLQTGEVREVDLSLCEPERDGEERVFLTLMRDVTGDKQAEEHRLRLERKMLDAQRLESLGVLAGGVAHDFNNLLTAILGNASLVMMQLPSSSTLRPFLEGIEKTSLQAADLCKQMLAYAGYGRMEFRCFSLNTLLEEMNHLLQVSVNKQILLRFRFAPSLSAVKAEPSEIQQVVMNLVVNASEAIGDRSGVITLSTGLIRADRAFLEETFLAPDLPAGDYVTLEVADTGGGMSPETMKRILDPFFTTKFTGRGLGLAAVLGIVQRHKGAIKVYSELGQGTVFKVLLPAAEVESDPEEEDAGDRLPQWKAEGKILVVDDEQSVRAVSARMLEKWGFTVLLAKDGGEALDVFHRHRDELDLVILDMTMPVMNGDEVFRRIRRLKGDAKVILMSGYAEAGTIDRFTGRGLAGFIQKPFKLDDLELKIRDALNLPPEEADRPANQNFTGE